ncbi:class I SAM-dependent methyltransferase [Mycobacterium sp. 663a-19]|nr:class I SAM-dependent methyltransferase [Mycobacterium sp. 663a-19]MEB3980329.1 class I SAM-dependent methyltransferase [Mycobacterium sp. 663a-19]
MSDKQRAAVFRFQDISHGEGHDYASNPHLRHDALHERLNAKIASVVAEVVSRRGTCAVLEIGAGHGSVTEVVLGAGGTPTVTEMSKASFEFLEHKFAGQHNVTVIYDANGSAPLRVGSQFDVILLISVIHHIPDYIEAVTSLCDRVLRPGGAMVTFQDPLWYPRQTRTARVLSWGSYFAWRATQGEIKRGLKTRWRRLRGVYDESEPSDVVEYHVVRQGVDELALVDLLRERFDNVEIDRYFSTQSALLQAIGAKFFPDNTFGIVASGHKERV